MARARRGLHAADDRSERATYADDLVANTETLDKRIQDLDLHRRPDRQRLHGLLDEVATGKVTGEEEYWSRTDLWDFQANVDGARVGFEGVRPIARAEGPRARRRRSTTRFAELQTLLDAQREGDGFVLYDDLTARAGQGALRRGQRAVRAAVPAHRASVLG